MREHRGLKPTCFGDCINGPQQVTPALLLGHGCDGWKRLQGNATTTETCVAK